MPGRNEWHVWRNGVLVGAHLASLPTTHDAIDTSLNELVFGDVSPHRFAGKVHFDYVRWDTSGAYAPNSAFAEIPGFPTAVAASTIGPAVEVEVETDFNVPYRVEGTTDLQDWTWVTGPLLGVGLPQSHFFSIGGFDRLFYRVVASGY
jgi:hypothetical protein